MKKTDVKKILENSFRDFPKKILWAFHLLSITNFILLFILVVLLCILNQLSESNRLAREAQRLRENVVGRGFSMRL